MVDLKVSEVLGGIGQATRGSALGNVARKFANKLERSKKGSLQFPIDQAGVNRVLGVKTASAKENPRSPEFNFKEAGKSTPGIQKPAPLKNINEGNGSSANGEVRKIIAGGWDDAEEVLKGTKKTLEDSGKTVSQLGKVRDKYLEANDKHYAKTGEAIKGNKQLIEKNQGQELDELGSDIRESSRNSQLLLGVKGATGGSASKAASKAISKAAGVNRRDILKTRGDEFSEQNQSEENAAEEYKLRREQAYEWEKTAREQQMAELKQALSAVSKLKSKVGGYKAKDQEAESDKYLTRFLNNLAEISMIGKTIRDNAYSKYQEFGGSVSELESAAIDIDAPSELMTPDFDAEIDLDNEEDAEDFFDPKNKGKQRVIIGHDAFGNPIYEDDPIAA